MPPRGFRVVAAGATAVVVLAAGLLLTTVLMNGVPDHAGANPRTVAPTPPSSSGVAGRLPKDLPTDQQLTDDQLAKLLGDVVHASSVEVQVKDDHGRGLHALQVIAAPGGGYLGVYHFSRGQLFSSAVTTSADLHHWTFRAVLATHASQPSISLLSDGGAIVVVEADDHGRVAHPSRWIRVLHYPDQQALLAGRSDRVFDAPHTLGGSRAGAEGTPAIESVHGRPPLDRSEVVISFHYLAGGTDREARGTLRDFSRWTTTRDTALDTALRHAGATGKHGDRAPLTLAGRLLQVVEAQDQPGGRWYLYLYDRGTGVARPVALTTISGARSAANPSVAQLRMPDGGTALVLTAYLPGQAGPGEQGELLAVFRILD